MIPNPGSDEALEQGCKCPVRDNARGAGTRFGPGTFWVYKGCELHHDSGWFFPDHTQEENDAG